MPTLADLLRTPGTPANTVKNTLSDLWRGYNREAVAGLLGAPVDMANTVSNMTRAGIGYTGHKLGMLAEPPDLIEKPALGSDWIYERLPGQPALTGSGAENTGRMLGALLSPPVVMQAAPGVARAMGKALQEKVPGVAENYLRGIGGQKDLIVYHGSPHKFDKFDSSKIGTGEGAQAYGHGLYLAETPETARAYQQALGKNYITVNGKRIDVDALPNAQKAAYQTASVQGVDNTLRDWAARAAAGDVNAKDPWFLDFVKTLKGLRGKDIARQNDGSLYRVDLPDSMLPRMLDWDAPLSGQESTVRGALHPIVMSALERQGTPRHALSYSADRKMGGDIIKDLLVGNGVGRKDVSQLLRQAGIPGIRYLDGGSRSAGTGTRNFVVFPGEEQNLRILERNGVPIK